MEDKISEAINHVRNKNRQRVTSERIFNHITKTKTLIDQGQLMEAVESMNLFSISLKENESLLFLLIKITVHGL